ncbi:M15 family metallopeptidase [Fictibacillus iocasae]|uniref:M15 family metallopeptidase n=1 Tax=Fictibacillus iocasae TaxID=2715437 RepID=A0ABW2NY01_9BACL
MASSRMRTRKKKKKTWLYVLLFFGAAFALLYHFELKYWDRSMPKGMHPVVAEKRDQLVREAAKKGIPIMITSDFRSAAEQEELYAKGRTKPGSIVTHADAGESYHNYGLAFDFALQNEAGEAVWDLERDGNKNGKSDWMEVADIGKDLGFEWGGGEIFGDFKDYPHFQMDFGLSIYELQLGRRPKVSE